MKLFYSKDSLKRKILDIKDDISKIVKPLCNEKFWVHWYGAYDVDPRNLVFWICVESDRIKLSLESDAALMKELRTLLDRYNYPSSARTSVMIGYESQETVDRESAGNWYVHFK